MSALNWLGIVYFLAIPLVLMFASCLLVWMHLESRWRRRRAVKALEAKLKYMLYEEEMQQEPLPVLRPGREPLKIVRIERGVH